MRLLWMWRSRRRCRGRKVPRLVPLLMVCCTRKTTRRMKVVRGSTPTRRRLVVTRGPISWTWCRLLMFAIKRSRSWWIARTQVIIWQMIPLAFRSWARRWRGRIGVGPRIKIRVWTRWRLGRLVTRRNTRNVNRSYHTQKQMKECCLARKPRPIGVVSLATSYRSPCGIATSVAYRTHG